MAGHAEPREEIVQGLTDGAALLLGALLLIAGVLKLSRPSPFAHALFRLLPNRIARRSNIAKAAAPLVGALETLAGAALLGAGWWPSAVSTTAAAAAAVLYCAFVPIVVVAIRKGAACGCFSSFSDGPAGGAELGRSLALAAVAVPALVLRLAAHPPHGWTWASVWWAAVLGTAVVAAALSGGRIRPVAPPRDPTAAAPSQPARRATARLLLGRVTSKLEAFDLPTVHRLRSDRRDHAVAVARATPSWLALEQWLGARAEDVDWEEASVLRSTARTVTGGYRQIRIELPKRGGLKLTVSYKLGEDDPADSTVFGMVDGRVVSANGGRVTLRETAR